MCETSPSHAFSALGESCIHPGIIEFVRYCNNEPLSWEHPSQMPAEIEAVFRHLINVRQKFTNVNSLDAIADAAEIESLKRIGVKVD